MGASGSTRSVAWAESSNKDFPDGLASAKIDADEDEELARALLSSMPYARKQESFEERLYRKITTEPLVPIGAGITTYFLVSGIRSFMNRDSARSQVMMRGRVLAQGCTVLAFCFYAGFDKVGLIKPSDFKGEK